MPELDLNEIPDQSEPQTAAPENQAPAAADHTLYEDLLTRYENAILDRETAYAPAIPRSRRDGC